MKSPLAAGLILFAASCITGCATMIRGTSEDLMITSEPGGVTAKVSDGQSCKTPCQVELDRDQTVLVSFEKEGCEKQVVTVFPTLAGAGVILGGVIDYGTGAVYSLKPNPVYVLMECDEPPTIQPGKETEAEDPESVDSREDLEEPPLADP